VSLEWCDRRYGLGWSLEHIVSRGRDTPLTRGAPLRGVVSSTISVGAEARGMKYDAVDAMVRSAIGGDADAGA
jgi:hypothetical protein